MLQATTESAYTTGAFGKWHLGIRSRAELQDPAAHGFDRYAGSPANLKKAHSPTQRKQSYTAWDKVDQGALVRVTTYATTETTDDALAFVAETDTPWLAWVAYNAPHSPYHVPPAHLHTRAAPRDVVARYDAMVEALDAELGRLIAGLGDRWWEHTVVIFLGDNGTPGECTVPPMDPDRAKHSLYEGGVKVPLIVAGPGVQRGKRTDALAVSTDLYATMAELAGADLRHPSVRAATDSLSLAAVLANPRARGDRRYAYAERFAPNGFGPKKLHVRAIRGDRYKLIRPTRGRDQLYDLGDAWVEGDDLWKGGPASATAKAAHARLAAELDRLDGS